jgi:hypothetical protein
MKNLKYLLFISLILYNCENKDDFDPSKLVDIFTLSIVDDNAIADGTSKITLRAVFPKDFNTEDDSKVVFKIFKETEEIVLSDIILTEIEGKTLKMAELTLSHNKIEKLKIKGTIVINQSSISKEVTINFDKAYFDSINVLSSSLTIKPNTFEEIDITTELNRNLGLVSLNSIAETIVMDTLGVSRGIFNNYQNSTKANGKIVNKFTLGNDEYEGVLYVISSSLNAQNETKKDTLKIFSQK